MAWHGRDALNEKAGIWEILALTFGGVHGRKELTGAPKSTARLSFTFSRNERCRTQEKPAQVSLARRNCPRARPFPASTLHSVRGHASAGAGPLVFDLHITMAHVRGKISCGSPACARTAPCMGGQLVAAAPPRNTCGHVCMDDLAHGRGHAVPATSGGFVDVLVL